MYQNSKRVAGYVISGALTVFAILLFAIYLVVAHDREMKIESTMESARGLALALSKEADATLYVAELALLRIADYVRLRPSRLSMDSRDLHELLLRNRQLLRRGEFKDSFGHLFILRDDGKNVANSVSYPVQQIDASDRAYFQFHQSNKTDTLHISLPIQSKVTLEQRIFLTLRLTDINGDFVGVAGVHFNLDHFNKLYPQYSLPVDSTITLVRTDGMGLFRYPQSDNFYSFNMSQQDYFKRVLVEQFGMLDLTSPYDQKRRLGGYKVSQKYPIVSFVSFTEEGVLSHWRQNAIVVSLIFFTITIVLVLVILYIRSQVGSIMRLTDLSTHDPLTGLWNRRAFDEKLEDEWRRASRRGYPLSLLFIDIDFFKNYNDTYGHQVGDRCLKSVAKLLSEQFGRAGEQVSRYGGEEFVVLLPTVAVEDATILAQKIVDGIRAVKIAHSGSAVSDVVTVSVGVASGTPEDHESATALVEAADDALYEAKSNGRNQIAVG